MRAWQQQGALRSHTELESPYVEIVRATNSMSLD